MRRSRGFSVLEVLVSIAILAMLTGALLAFGMGLGDRRDRLMREGERAAVLARVFDRLERASLSALGPVRTGVDWAEVDGRGVWPSAEGVAGPIGPVDYAGRLSFSAASRELVWQEVGPSGQTIELRATDIEAVRVDRFEDLALTRGATPPVRVRVWLRALGLPEEEADGAAEQPVAAGPLEPIGRPADFVRTVSAREALPSASEPAPEPEPERERAP